MIHDHDGRDPLADYMPLCRRCHAAYDGLAEMVSRAMTGQRRGPHSPETNQKIAEGKRRYWQRMTPAQRAETSERMSAGQLRRWERKAHEQD